MKQPIAFCKNPMKTISWSDNLAWVNDRVSVMEMNNTALIPFLKELIDTNEVISTSIARSEEERVNLEHALLTLEKAGAIVRVDDARPWHRATLSLYNYCSEVVQPKEIEKNLNNASVEVIDPKNRPASRELYETIMSQLDGLSTKVHLTSQIENLTDPKAIKLIISDARNDKFIDAVNEKALSQDWRIWLPITPPMGASFELGPWFYPHSSACRTCERIRRSGAADNDQLSKIELESDATSMDPNWSFHSSLHGKILLSLVVDATIRHIGLDGAFGQAIPGGSMRWNYSLNGPTIENERLLRVPRCPSCSSVSGTGYPQIWFHETEAEMDTYLNLRNHDK